jgi:hypothetical protein
MAKAGTPQSKKVVLDAGTTGTPGEGLQPNTQELTTGTPGEGLQPNTQELTTGTQGEGLQPNTQELTTVTQGEGLQPNTQELTAGTQGEGLQLNTQELTTVTQGEGLQPNTQELTTVTQGEGLQLNTQELNDGLDEEQTAAASLIMGADADQPSWLIGHFDVKARPQGGFWRCGIHFLQSSATRVFIVTSHEDVPVDHQCDMPCCYLTGEEAQRVYNEPWLTVLVDSTVIRD